MPTGRTAEWIPMTGYATSYVATEAYGRAVSSRALEAYREMVMRELQFTREGIAELIIRDRQRGKTTKLIALAAKENNAIIVVRNTGAARQTKRMAEEAGYKIRMPITYEDLEKIEVRRELPIDYKLLLDDVDEYLKYKLGNVYAMTMSSNMVKLEDTIKETPVEEDDE